MIEDSDATRLESKLRVTLSEIMKNVSITESYKDSSQVSPTFRGLTLLYKTFTELWADVRELREGNYLPEVGQDRKENIIDAYDYLRDMADRIENGEIIRQSEQLSLKSYINEL